jgi:hypothetical protein
MAAKANELCNMEEEDLENTYIPRVRLVALTAEIMKTTVFWNMTPCSVRDIYEYSCFGGRFCLYLPANYSSAMKMEAADSSRKLVNIYTAPYPRRQ